MENLKIERNQLRKYFKKTCQDVDVALAHSNPVRGQVMIYMRQLESKSERIFALDEHIREGLFSSDVTPQEIEEEMDEVEHYKEEMINYTARCEFILKEESEGSCKNESLKVERRRFKLPMLELKKFNGDVRNWIGFWAQYKKIHEDDHIDDEDKFQYLIQAMEPGSIARKIVESFPPSKANYEKALNKLKNRCARDEFLIEVYVRELLSLVLQQVTKGRCAMSLANLYDKLETQLTSLESLGVTSDKYAAMLYPLVESSLPADILKTWERQRSTYLGEITENNSNNSNFLTLLLDFLRREVEAEQRITLAQKSFASVDDAADDTKVPDDIQVTTVSHSNRGTSKQEEQQLFTAATLYSQSSKGNIAGKKVPKCIFCDQTHLSQDCFKAQKMSMDDRKNKVIKKRGCFSCLKQNHTSRNCKNFVRCIICTKKHYPILCPELAKQKEGKSITGNSEHQVDNSLMINYTSETLLQTILVKIINKENNKVKIIRALLDSGSQRSYILAKYANELNFVRKSTENIIQGVFGGQINHVLHYNYDIIAQNLNEQYEINMQVLDQEKICNYIPRLYNLDIISELQQKNIILSDTSFSSAPLEIGLLIGADFFGMLFTGNLQTLSNGLIALETRLGWTIIGKCPNVKPNVLLFSGLSNCSISSLWNLDVLGIRDPLEVKSKEKTEEETLKFFHENIMVNEDGRYEVRLPWNEEYQSLCSNKTLSEQRLMSTSKRLTTIGKLNDYENVLLEWQMLGVVEEIEEENPHSGPVHYLPHHAVIKEASKTTKIRPVFDASARDGLGNSLNSCLQTGPNLIELIPSLLIKFRLGIIGVTADIEKAFLQISISPKDRNFLRFYWWSNYQEKIKKIFRHCRVVFGIKCSPFLLAATINYHISHSPLHLKDTAKKIANSFYVDNLITSVNNIEELEKLIKESKELMTLAQFNLREWYYTTDNVVSSVEFSSVLGMLWDIPNDLLFCDLKTLIELRDTPKTKRGLLSVAHRVFDPIGYTCPVTLIPKMLLQETWELKVGWDKELPENIAKRFEKWLKEINLLSFCKIPRSISKKQAFDIKESSIHVFSDSSKLAYGTCIFLRMKINNNVLVQLIQAKSRTAPKNVTIPKLELIANLIGVRLSQHVQAVKELSVLETFYWTDSTVALTWIKTKGPWKTFVQNRVNEINKYTAVSQWNFVPGELNIADITSRGCSSKMLLENRWWEGPNWLKQDSETWPHWEMTSSVDADSERKNEIVCNIVHDQDLFTKHFHYFSKFSRIVRMIAWIIRFYNHSSGKILKQTKCVYTDFKQIEELTYEEILKAELRLIKIIQKEGLVENRKIDHLEFLTDENNILRLKTRLTYCNESYNFKFPILLPSKHEIVRKFILEQHKIHNHAGVQTLLCIIRENYWILRGRRTIKEVTSKCITCKRFNSKSISTPLAPLPKDRINNAAVFEISGVDLAGPLYLKDGSKVWVVLFTCAVFRAIHLELVTAISTDNFLLSLRRFITRRGRISVLYSDNGTNFTGANNCLKKMDWTKILDYSSIRKIKWIFNIPTAAWWGGFWERIVRMIKELLRRNLGKACVNYEELLTVLCDCEAIINTRPLTYVSENDQDLIPLTPSMFLYDLTTCEIPDLDNIDRNHIIRRYRYLQKLRDDIRSRFRNEYLAQLIHHHQQRKLSRPLKIGDVVYVEQENIKRINWPLGRILELIEGKDGNCRAAKVKLQHGEILRPFQKLYPLEVDADCESKVHIMKERKERLEKKAVKQYSEQTQKLVGKEKDDKDEVNGQARLKETEEGLKTRSGRLVKPVQRFGFKLRGEDC